MTHPWPCTTPGCPGDGRYAAPGRHHFPACRHPLLAQRAVPSQGLSEAAWREIVTEPDTEEQP